MQIALAWLLHASPAMLPIPGTGSPGHLEENIAAAEIELSADDMRELDALADVPRDVPNGLRGM